MPAISAAFGKTMLDFTFKGAAATQAVGVFGHISLGSPTNVSASEAPTSNSLVAQTIAMPPASTAAATNSSATVANTAALTWGPVAAGPISASGFAIKDTVSSGAGTLLWYGLLATVRSAITGDSLVMAVGSLTALLG